MDVSDLSPDYHGVVRCASPEKDSVRESGPAELLQVQGIFEQVGN